MMSSVDSSEHIGCTPSPPERVASLLAEEYTVLRDRGWVGREKARGGLGLLPILRKRLRTTGEHDVAACWPLPWRMPAPGHCDIGICRCTVQRRAAPPLERGEDGRL